MSLLDVLFPKKCVGCKKFGAYICETCFATLSFDVKVICVVCNTYAIDGRTHPGCRNKYTIDGIFCSVVYTPLVRKLIYAFKYQPYLTSLSNSMVDLLYEGLIQQEKFMSVLSQQKILFIPIPLSKEKYRKRGYNHAKIIADTLAKKFDITVSDCLERIRETKPQFGLKREERIKNIKGAFIVKRYYEKKLPATVFLVDDVLTSGSTLAEAAKILKHAGVKNVWGVTFAREQNK